VTLFLDTSALLKRYVQEPGTAVVIDAMAEDGAWTASAIARAEAELALCHLIADEDRRLDAVGRLRRDWERFFVVPLDHECLEQAVKIGCEHRVRTLDALHLGAAARLPAPVTMLTFDARQAAAASAMGLIVRPEPETAEPGIPRAEARDSTAGAESEPQPSPES